MFSYSNSFHVIIQTPEVPYGKNKELIANFKLKLCWYMYQTITISYAM